MDGEMENKIFRVGLLVPSSNTTIEGDFHRNLPEDVEVITSRMFLEHTTKNAEIYMIEESLPDAIRMIRTAKPHVTVFGCTSAGSLFGQGYDASILQDIRKETGTEVVSILSALSEEFALLGAMKIAVFTPYIEELNETIRASLEEDGFDVLSIDGMGIVDNTRIGSLRGEEILAFARDKINHAHLEKADCLFFSCTNLPAIRALPLLQENFPKTSIMTSNLAAIRAVHRRREKTKAKAAVTG